MIAHTLGAASNDRCTNEQLLPCVFGSIEAAPSQIIEFADGSIGARFDQHATRKWEGLVG